MVELARPLQPLLAGLNIVMPFVGRVATSSTCASRWVLPPQPVITEDNLVVSIDTVIYFQVTDPIAATYGIANYIQAVEQLTMTTLRNNIVGGMDLERDADQPRADQLACAACWTRRPAEVGHRVNRVEIRGIDRRRPSGRDGRCAPIATSAPHPLTAEGQRQILTAEGNKQSSILSAEG